MSPKKIRVRKGFVFTVGAVLAVGLITPFAFATNTTAQAKPSAKPMSTVTRTVTATTTVTAPGTTTTVTAPGTTTTTTVTETVTAPPVTSTTTVTQPPVTQTVTVTASPTSTTTVPTTTTTTPSSTTTTTTPPPTGCPVAGVNKPGASDGMGGCFPGPGNTGVPAGVALTNISGDYIVQANNTTIDAVNIGGNLNTNGKTGTVLTRSRVGGIIVGSNITILDSNIVGGNNLDYKVLFGDGPYTVKRSVLGGGQANSAGACSNCLLEDNYVFTNPNLGTTSTHLSAMRMRQFSTFTHNTFYCVVTPNNYGGGCSGNLTGYGDWEPVSNNTITKNLLMANVGNSFCSYGGASGGKPYSGQDHDIVFRDNVFQRGTNGKCGYYDAVGDYNPAKPGNVPGWTSTSTQAQKDAALAAANNRFDDGVLLAVTDFS